MIDTVEEVTKADRIMYRGVCAECDSKVSLMGGYSRSSIKSSSK
jgi:hypothetical protein